MCKQKQFSKWFSRVHKDRSLSCNCDAIKLGAYSDSAAGKDEDATMVGIALGKLQRGDIEDATKTLSVAEFELEMNKRKK